MTLPKSQKLSGNMRPIPLGLIAGTLVGAAAASLSDQFRGVLNEDPAISLAIAGSAIGLLAVIIAVITLVLTFRTGLYSDIIAAADPDGTDDLGITNFLSPFKQVAILSAGAAIVSLVSLLFGPSQDFPKGTGPEALEVTVFGIGVWLFVWAVVGTVRLIYIVQRHAINAAKSEQLEERLKADQQTGKVKPERDADSDGPESSSTGQ